MKKIVLTLGILAGLLVLNSCGSTPVLDHGYYSDGQEQTETASVIVDENIIITGIDKDSSIIAEGVEGWAEKEDEDQIQTFTINKGVHTISVKFNNGSMRTMFSKVLIAQFEANKEYKIVYDISYLDKKITYDIIDTADSKSVLLDTAALQGKSANPVSQFIKAVLNPTMEGSDKTVIEENDDYVLTSLPSMKYELKNKKDGSVQKGFRGFETDFTFKKGTVYLYETDKIDSKDEFLKTDYQKTSGTVLEVSDCDQKTVTYKYVKPDNLAGKTITFNIKVQ